MSSDLSEDTPESQLSARYPRALVTGGSGFIGSHVVEQLLDANVEVRCLVLPSDPAPALEGLPVERIDGDITNAEVVAMAARGCDIVFNLAAIYALWLPRREKMFEVNVKGTVSVMAGARRAGVRRVVHTSSIAAIGVLPGREVSDETVLFNDWCLGDDYVLSKYISELEAFRAGGDDLEVVCANPAFPFGAGDRAPTPTGKMVRDTLRGRVPFVVEGGFNVADVRDVARGHLLAAVRGEPGERYLLGGHNVTFLEFAELIAARSGRKPPPLRVSAKAVKTLGRVGDFVADHITHQAPLVTEGGSAYLAGRHVWVSSDKARLALGYEIRPIEEAIDASIAWFRKQL